MGSNNSQIAKNTIALYARSLIVLAVSLYTSRVILSALGVEDYGVYNVVGGVIAMLGFLNASMTATFQRYFNVAMGEKREEDIKILFRSSLTVQLFLAIAIVVLGETIGLWFLSNKLVLPEGRLTAAQVLYQVTIISFVLSVFKAPFRALITAYEKMSIYAVFAIIESFLKLAIALIIQFVSGDKLVIYSFLVLLITIIDFFLYSEFCRKKIPTTSIGFNWDRKLLKNMTSFSTWSTIGSFSYTMSSQGLNIVLNLFFGTVVNAARGIAYQILHAVNQFISSFQTAFRPQLTKLYASGDYEAAKRLYYSATKLSYYLIFTISLPILLETEFILHIWLGDNVPEYAAIFTQLILLTAFVSVFANPTSCIAHATGNIKYFSIITSSVNLLIVPVAYLFLYLGYAPTSAMVVSFVIAVIVQVIRLLVVTHITVLTVKDYILNVILPVTIYTTLSIILPIFFEHIMMEGLLRLLIVLTVSMVSSICVAWLVGLNKVEKQFVKSKMRFLK